MKNSHQNFTENILFYNKHFDEKVSIKRILGSVKGKAKSPTVIFFAGMHGNEIAGVIALNKIFDKIEKEQISFKGNVYAICGNINALQKDKRYIDIDLNRVWTKEIIKENRIKNLKEFNEQQAILYTIKTIIGNNEEPFYFIDLHTTSSDSKPFLTISDSLNNRKFAENFKIPTILGIEEFLEGPLLTYINEFGYISLGFEAGQHYKETSIDNCIAFIWLALVASGCVAKQNVKKFAFYQHYLSLYNTNQEFFEITHRYSIAKNEDFKMLNGFSNFDKITIGEELAISNDKLVKSEHLGSIFMPLYQKQGEDGFFIISKISKLWLRASIIVRNLKLDLILRILPGVTVDKNNTYTLIVNPKTAKFLATKIFHLFGYRKRIVKNKKYYFIKRDRKITPII